MESVKPGAFQSHGIGGASAAPANGLRFSQLSAPRQTLVRLCQAINHGSIENLEVRSSEPVFNPLPPPYRHFFVAAWLEYEPNPAAGFLPFHLLLLCYHRSEERRVGKECRSRWSRA